MDHFAAKKNLIPKIQTVTWDSDKNPDGFHEWSVTIASIVQTMPGGRSLETFLDLKLQRNIDDVKLSVPEFCTLDEWQDGGHDESGPPFPASPFSDASSVAAVETWAGLPIEAKRLDLEMVTIIYSIIKG